VCGIAGLQLHAGTPIDASVLDRLTASLEHRGPDSSGRFVDSTTALVSTRLAIVDLLHGDQPLHSASGLVLVANAEIYNAPELRARFPSFPYRTRSDCEVIFPLFDAYGVDFARHLRGMYAIALFEPVHQRLILSRDPFGIKPLYIRENGQCFSFASEPGALLAAGLAEPREDRVAKAELLQLKYVVGTKTIIEGVHRVRPGVTLSVQDCQA
jgi:asparagine synthase (glutamine-hydrolysing)